MTQTDDAPIIRYRYWILLAVSLLLYVAFLGVRDFWYPDEPDIGEVAQAMYLSGDWIAPRRNGVIWIDYWPMLYWAGCVCCHVLGGVSEFALRLASAIGGIALILWTCRAASRVFGARAGLWAGFILLTSSSFLYGAISYRPDILFSLFIGGAFFAYAAGSGERTRWWPRIFAFALLGAAILTKGPLGLLLPGLVLTLWHASRREWKRLFQLAPLALVAIAVAAPWTIACGNAMGPELFWSEIERQNFSRAMSGSQGHGKPPYYYLKVIWLDMGPWVFMFPLAIAWIIRTGRLRDRNVQLMFWWVGTFLVFLSITATKRQVYLMPAYPAIALLLGAWFAGLFRPNEEGEAPSERAGRWFIRGYAGWLTFVGVVALVVGVGIELLISRLDIAVSAEAAVRATRVPAIALGVTCTVLGVWIWRTERGGALRAALFGVAASLVPFYVILLAWLVPAFNGHKTYAPQCAWIVEQIPEEETHIGLYFPRRNVAKMGAWGFYTERLVSLVWSTEHLERFFRDHPDSVALVSDTVSEELFAEPDSEWQSMVVEEFEAGRYRYFVLRRQ